MLRKANPDMEETAIPVELVTCSGSGLDQHISLSKDEQKISDFCSSLHNLNFKTNLLTPI